MSIKKILAIASMYSVFAEMGQPITGRGKIATSKEKLPPPRNINVEEQKEKLLKHLEATNKERKELHKKFKPFLVHGNEVIALNEKNAIKYFEWLLREYSLQITLNKD